MIDKSLFKNASGAFITKGLFWETALITKENCVYTFKDEDIEREISGSVRLLPSIRRLYLEINDETEYRFAKECFYSWSHFKKLLECSWFKDYLSDMREELSVMNESRAREVILKKAESGDYHANKHIVSEITGSRKSTVGRPSKEKIRQEANKLFNENSEILDDYRRITEDTSNVVALFQ